MLLQGRGSAAPEGGRKKDRVFHLKFTLDNPSSQEIRTVFKNWAAEEARFVEETIKQAAEKHVPLSRSTDF